MDKQKKHYTDEYKHLRNINTMKENQKKREKKKPNIFPLKGEYLISMFIKEQNRIILQNIAKDKFKNQDEREMFIDKYLKPNYYIPEVTKKKKFEDLQQYVNIK